MTAGVKLPYAEEIRGKFTLCVVAMRMVGGCIGNSGEKRKRKEKRWRK